MKTQEALAVEALAAVKRGDAPDVDTLLLDDTMPRENGLTDRKELFCQVLGETGNQSLAYRRAYRLGPNVKPGIVWNNAYVLSQKPEVQARMRVIWEASATNAVANRARLINFLWMRIFADRRTLVNYVRRCCRHCHGERHQYQWKDELEYALALAKWMDDCNMVASQRPKGWVAPAQPSFDGGVGFDPHREPEPTCDSQQCMGDGQGTTIIADTTTLQGDAALIYEGMKETAQGIEVKIADRNADMLMLAKLQGWSIDKVQGEFKGMGGAKEPGDYEIPATATPEEATRAYLAAVS